MQGISLQDLFAMAQDQSLRFPSTLTFVMKAFSTLEGSLSLFSLSLSHKHTHTQKTVLYEAPTHLVGPRIHISRIWNTDTLGTRQHTHMWRVPLILLNYYYYRY